MEETNESEKRVGVYICHCGGNISDVVDTPTVAQKIMEHPDVVVAKHFIFMCSDPGQNLIIEDIILEKLTHVIVAACSPNLHRMTFQKILVKNGMNPYMYEHVNIREQDSWVHSHHPEEATEKAIRLINGAIERVTRQTPLEPIKRRTVQNAVVIGGGISGLTASLDLARSGVMVDLIEKSPYLGGRVAQLHKLYPTEDSAQEVLNNLVNKVNSHQNITVYLNTTIVQSEGTIGNYEIVVRTIPRGVNTPLKNLNEIIEFCPEEVDDDFEYGLVKRKAIYQPKMAFPELPAIDWDNCTKCGICIGKAKENEISLNNDSYEFSLYAGAVIIATGFDPYEPQIGEFGYKENPFVITLPQLERMLIHNQNQREFVFNGKKIENIAMIHCVGSREEPSFEEGVNNNTYCSRYCCTATLHAASEIKEQFAGVNIYDFYRDIRTYGEREIYYDEASQKNVVFFKYPDTKPPQVILPELNDGMITLHSQDILTYGSTIEAEVDLVVLAVGMVPREHPKIVSDLSIPTGKDNFVLEAHPKLRPVESIVDGIFLAGTAQAPMDTTESSLAASAAATKAANILLKEEIELSPFVAAVSLSDCDGNGVCVAECEYNAIKLHPGGVAGNTCETAVIEPGLCVGCGACVPACPKNAITLKGYDLKQIKAQVRGFIMEVTQ